MDSNSVLWVTTVIMAVGGLAILVLGKHRTRSEELHTVLHGIVPLIAACAYLAMATGQGLVVLPAGGGATRIFYFARYIDWTFTTPLLLVSLGMTAMQAGPKRHGAIVGSVLADVMMIVTAFVFGASRRAGPSGPGSSCPARRSWASTTSSGSRRWRPTRRSATTCARPTGATRPSCRWCGWSTRSSWPWRPDGLEHRQRRDQRAGDRGHRRHRQGGRTATCRCCRTRRPPTATWPRASRGRTCRRRHAA